MAASLEWSARLAYAVGLIATDGCLVSGRRRIDFVSNDRELAEALNACLGLAARIRADRTRRGTTIYRMHISNPALYCWLQAIGLTPRKSLTLAGIDVPDEFFLPLVLGLLDGDGSILNAISRADTNGRPGYLWEHLQVRFHSASRAHIDWLRDKLDGHLGVKGYVITRTARNGRSDYFCLRFGKRESVRLLPALYAYDVPALQRKRHRWIDYATRHSIRYN